MQTSTHGLTIGATAYAPGLAPRPLRREDGETPVIVMERIPGDPLGPRPLTTVQTEALGASLRRLYGVPVELVREAGVGPRRHGAAEHAQVMREWLAGDHDLGECLDPVLVGEAVDVARAFVVSPPVPEHLGSRLRGVYDMRALADAVGLDAEARERLEAYRPLWAAFWLAMLLPGNGGWRRNPRGTTEGQARHFMALAARD